MSQDRWDLGTPEGIALIEAILRQTYPMAAVVGHDGVWAGGIRRTIVLDVYRDGPPGAAERELSWLRAVYERSGVPAYRTAVELLGEGAPAERAVEQAFRELRRSVTEGVSVAAGGAAVESATRRHASRARATRDTVAAEPVTTSSAGTSALTNTSLRRGGARRSLSNDAMRSLLSAQREVLELSLLEDLKVGAIADRMQTTPSVVHRHLGDALLAVEAGVPPSTALTLAHWREAQRQWADRSADDPSRAHSSRSVAHAWLDYQVASGAITPETVVLVTDVQRRFVTASANAALALGRSSVVGLQIDDVTAEYARPLVANLWTVFDANGAMAGEYDCDRPDQTPIRMLFRAVWAQPIPDLQVGYLQPAAATSVAVQG
ncbi:MAG: hypothetical protein NVS9B8_03660 [Candidatus Limnocylindrales bacterium]